MKAAVLYGKEDVRVEEVTPRALKPGEVRIQIEASLTCGTDLKVFRRGYHAQMIVPPAVFGHEFAGVVCEACSAKDERDNRRTGTTARPWRAGDHVVVANSAPCGKCFFCRNGQENICDDLLFLNGAYAESIIVPSRLVQKNLLRLKPETSFCDAALTEPLACVVQGVEETKVQPGQRVLVIGAGPIGLMFLVLARNLGCEVTVSGRAGKRLKTAKQLGAAQVFKVPEQMETHHVLPKGCVFDVIFEAVGKPETWEAAVRLVRKGGTINFFGGCPAGTKVALDTSFIHYSNLKLLASFHHTPRTIRRALALIESGLIRAADFVDGECALSGLPALFKSMAAGNRAVKTLIDVRQ